jgi:hypothetical protein
VLVLTLINDHYAAVEERKLQQQQQQQHKKHKHSSVGAAIKPVPGTHHVVSGAKPLFSGARRKVLSESECRTHAVLKGVCSDGTLHIRPLCTSGDVLLALHELMDSKIFMHGCIQLPHVLDSEAFARHVAGYYRYVYALNADPQWQYLRYVC